MSKHRLVVLLIIALAVLVGVYWLSFRDNPIKVNSSEKLLTPSPKAPKDMVRINGGTFRMGRDDGDEYERPSHLVTVDPFYLDQYEVTCSEYQKFIDATGYPEPRSWQGGRFPEGRGQQPVTDVSWTDAVAFSQWAGKRLPTEEEWEFAARDGGDRLYPWGNNWMQQAANAHDSSAGGVVDIKSYPKGATPTEVYDMSGNVWEWTASQLQPYPSGHIPEDNLPEARRRNLKVIRGGCYESKKTQATTTYRMGWPAQRARSYAQTGFRCARDIRE